MGEYCNKHGYYENKGKCPHCVDALINTLRGEVERWEEDYNTLKETCSHHVKELNTIKVENESLTRRVGVLEKGMQKIISVCKQGGLIRTRCEAIAEQSLASATEGEKCSGCQYGDNGKVWACDKHKPCPSCKDVETPTTNGEVEA